MLHVELSKDTKKRPEIEYAIPKKIFAGHEPGPEQEDNTMVKLFNFT